MVGFFLDVSLPGTEEERGILKWRQTHESKTDDETKFHIASIHTYDIPFVTGYLQNFPFVRHIPFLPYYGKDGDVEDLRNGNATKMDKRDENEEISDILDSDCKETSM